MLTVNSDRAAWGSRVAGADIMAKTVSFLPSTLRRSAAVLATLVVAGTAYAAERSVPEGADAVAPLPGSSSLTVLVTVPHSEGQVRLGLFASPDAYAGEDAGVSLSVPVENGRARVTLADLAPGRYAFRLFHDANDNGQLDTTLFGWPSEPLYFSNGASDMFSAPEWGEASFRLPQGDYAFDVALD